ncbi:alpha/beta fold hydrolase [bacterium]|nr:alpha/beta fold hydrolase [bacterium]
MSAAPLHDDLADGPADGRAFWLKTADGTRIRAAIWHACGQKGTVVLLPGRSEYVEKYGRTARALAEAGYAVLTVDWRGQGLADRALPDRMVGHVVDFAEFQDDLDTLLTFAAAQGLPQPFHMLAHSMGGAIGLRALMRGLAFRTVAFSAPMWGIALPWWQKPFALPLSTLACALGQGHRYAPGTGPANYVLDEPFAGNVLTNDPGMWDYMRRQALAQPDLSLGGPSLNWLHAALTECNSLAGMPSPALPCLCALGTLEQVVDPEVIRSRMKAWPNGRLHLVEGGQHEVLMETPALCHAFLDAALGLFSG